MLLQTIRGAPPKGPKMYETPRRSTQRCKSMSRNLTKWEKDFLGGHDFVPYESAPWVLPMIVLLSFLLRLLILLLHVVGVVVVAGGVVAVSLYLLLPP